MTPTDGPPGPHRVPGEDWERGGARIGRDLDDTYHLVLVIGGDPDDTAHAALGVARAQSHRRRVALGDLIGDAPPIQRLLTGDDPHGFVDSFLYGVSLNRIARHVPGSGELYVLPSGSDAPDYEEILGHPRWRRISSGFRETGSLLVVALPAGAAGLDNVARIADGVILLGDGTANPAADARVLGVVEPVAPDRSPVFLTPTGESVAVADTVTLPASDDAAASVPSRADRVPAAPVNGPVRRWRVDNRAAAFGGIGLAVVVGAIGIWLAARPLASGHEPEIRTRKGVTGDSAVEGPVLDSSAGASGVTGPLLPVANPSDSGGAAAYGVALNFWNTRAGSEAWFQKNWRGLPAVTFTPVMVRGALWYRAYAGAYVQRGQADSLLSALKATGAAGEQAVVVRLPYAFLQDSVPASAVPGMLSYFADRGLPVYALRSADGTARLYVGAFENRAQASLFLQSIGVSGYRPVLVYRFGRVD